MPHRLLPLFFSFAVLLNFLGFYEKVWSGEVQITFDRAAQIYACGEKAEITITPLNNDGSTASSGTLEVDLSNDGGENLRYDVYDLAEKSPVTLLETLSFPGFLKVKAVYQPAESSKRYEGVGAAGFDPEKIKPSLPEPDDFEEFIARGKKEVREIPIDVEIMPIESWSNDDFSVNRISFATTEGLRIHGFLTIPLKAPKPLPALVHIPGADSGVGPNLGDANDGFVALNMNVYPYPVPLEEAEREPTRDKFLKELGAEYEEYHGDDRETYFFRHVFLGIDRAIDWLAEQDYVDASRIGYGGTSQGGGSGLILCAMNHHISQAVISVPALCDQTGTLIGRSSGWPKLIEHYPDNPQMKESVRYCDAVNFARHIPEETSVTISVGFIDPTCPPSSVYAAYNVIPSKDKKIFPAPLLGHQMSPEHFEAFKKMKEDLKQKK